MAVTKSNQTQNAPATATGRNQETKKTLGFLNINIATVSGSPLRLEAVRLLEGNRAHEQTVAYLNMQRPGDENFKGEALVAEKLRRLEEFVGKLIITFNPVRTDEETMLDLV